jgi:DNA-binding response OmpR family regulator
MELSMKRILYVEDDSTLCAIFKLVMERRGYAVDIALNGGDGMAMHTAEPYDIVALDYQLPDMTGRGNEKIAAEALEIGVCNYIVKDSERSYLDLLPAVVSHLERRLEIIQVMRLAEESLRESSEQLNAQLLTQIDTADRYEQQAMELVEQAEALAVAKVKLDDYAYYDEKTGLPNLRLCLDRMEFALGAAQQKAGRGDGVDAGYKEVQQRGSPGDHPLHWKPVPVG